MQVGIDYGQTRLDLEIQESNLVEVRRQPIVAALPDPVAAVRHALEEPFGFPALRRALTPDDHVAIVLGEHLPRLPELLVPLLEHILQALVQAEAITLLCLPGASREWLDELPAALQDVHVEVHDPTNRKQLSYLAATKQGRRLYLNRTVVDADQVVVLSRRGYDPVLGYSGSEGTLFPALSDEATRQEFSARFSNAVPGVKPWPARQEATEAAWLLGAPFMVQLIEGAGDELAHVVGGPAATSVEGQRLLNARWRVRVEQLADLVIAGIGGNPDRHDFAALARALACAARVVKPAGHIVLLTQAQPRLGPGADLLRQAEEPQEALALLRQHQPPDQAAAFQWASAAQQASIYLLSGLPGETVEELFATPLDHPGQLQRLVGSGERCLVLPDAHKTLAVTTELETSESREQ